MKIYLLILIIIITSCRSNREDIDIFFDRLYNVTTKEEREEMKKCKNIDSLKIFAQKHKIFAKEFDKLPIELEGYLSDSIKITEPYNRQVALLMAFQQKLVSCKTDFIKINKEIIDYNNLNDKKYINNYKKEIQTQLELAKINFNKFKIGNKLNLLFPLKKSGNFKEVYFNNFYYEKKYDDTLFLSCILIKKEIEKIDSSNFGHDEYNFSLRILDAKNKELNMVDIKYRKGNTIFLSLYSYGRNID